MNVSTAEARPFSKRRVYEQITSSLKSETDEFMITAIDPPVKSLSPTSEWQKEATAYY